MSFSPQAVRERIASNATAANAALALHGHTLPNAHVQGKSALLKERNDARRAIRDMLEATRNRQPTPAEATALDTLADVAALIDSKLDLDSAVAAALDGSGNGSVGDWRTADGSLVRMLDTATLRSPAAIANRMGVANIGERPDFDLADFVRGVAGNRGKESIRNALSVGTDAAGGYTVPSVLLPGLLSALVPQSSLLTSGALIGLLDQGKTHRVAGINAIPTAAWRAEAGTVATSDPTFRAIDLVPRSLAFQFKVSRELLADSPNLSDGLTVAIAQAFAKELDRVGLRGTGTAPEPRGILNTVGIQSVTNGTNGASLATTAYANLISAMQAIRAADGPMPTAAIMAPRSLAVLVGLLDTTNQPRQVPPALAAWQMVDTSQIPINLTVGSSTDCSEIYVADFRNFAFFIREGVSVQLATELYAGTGEVGFFCHARVDVAALYPAAFAVATGVRP